MTGNQVMHATPKARLCRLAVRYANMARRWRDDESNGIHCHDSAAYSQLINLEEKLLTAALRYGVNIRPPCRQVPIQSAIDITLPVEDATQKSARPDASGARPFYFLPSTVNRLHHSATVLLLIIDTAAAGIDFDPDLSVIVEAWPTLPEAIKEKIPVVIRTSP